MHVFDLEIADIDRGVYQSVVLNTARHPSESAEYLATRLLAFALEWEEGISFSSGLCAADEPAVWVRDLTGRMVAWIEVGTPDPERLHRATKAADRVAVYCHKESGPWLDALRGARIFAPEKLTVVVLERRFVEGLAAAFARRTKIVVSRTEGVLFVEVDGKAFESELTAGP